MRNIEIFDALGLRNNQEKWKKYLRFEGIEINDFPVQLETSNTCASFVIYYICNRFYNGKFVTSIKSIKVFFYIIAIPIQKIWILRHSWIISFTPMTLN